MFFRFLAGFGSDIDELGMNLRGFLPILRVEQMNGFPADDPQGRSFLPVDPDAFSREELLIHPADGSKIDIALFVDVFHHEADLVAVAGEHDDGSFLSL